MDERSLRQQVREAIRAGHLPDRLPDKLFGGIATGAVCAVCGESVADGMEVELVFTDDGRNGRSICQVHPRCLSVFESEITDAPAPQSPIDDVGKDH
jgi:hypothetical protein